MDDTNYLTASPPAKELSSSVSVTPDLPLDKVSDEEAKAAAAELNMTFFSPARSRLLKKIGLFQAQMGVVHLGLGRLAAAEEALGKMIDAAVSIAEDSKKEDEVRVAALTAGSSLVTTLQKSITLAVEFQQDKLIQGPQNNNRRVFVDDKPVVPIQAQPGSTVNISIDSKPKVDQTTS